MTEDFLTSIAKGAKVADIPRWDQDSEVRCASAPRSQRTTAEAEGLGFGGTPSFAVEGPGTNGLEPLGTLGTLGEFEEAIETRPAPGSHNRHYRALNGRQGDGIGL